MLTQLELAGVLDQIRGFVFGKCTDFGTANSPGGGYGSLMMEQVLDAHIRPLQSSLGGSRARRLAIACATTRYGFPLPVSLSVMLWRWCKGVLQLGFPCSGSLCSHSGHTVSRLFRYRLRLHLLQP